jgi:uncharacterized protein (UPF0335 family)
MSKITSRISAFMLWLSGADQDVLSHCEGERSKFVAMGGTVLTTSVLATLAATFTTHQFLHVDLVPAIVLGLAWGLAILNLDRWLLISIRRQDSAWKTVGMALPRVVLAVLVGVVIAHPLVLRAFEPEVRAQATEDTQAAYSEGREDLRDQFSRTSKLQESKRNLQSELKSVASGAALQGAPDYQDAVGELERLERRWDKAVYGGKGTVAEELRFEVAAQRAQVASIRSRILTQERAQAKTSRVIARGKLGGVQKRLARLEDEHETALHKLKKAHNEPIGLLDRVEALDNLTSEHSAMLWAQIFIFLFILAVDTMPALAKVLMSVGKPSLYEEIQNALERGDASAVQALIDAHVKTNEIDAALIVDEAETRKRFAKEAQDDLVKKAVDAMREAGEQFVELWRRAILREVPGMVDRELESNGMGPVPPPQGDNSNGNGNGSKSTDSLDAES